MHVGCTSACTHGHHHMSHVQCTHSSEVVCMHAYAICYKLLHTVTRASRDARRVVYTAWTSYIEVRLSSKRDRDKVLGKSDLLCMLRNILRGAARSIAQSHRGFPLYTHGEKMASS